MIVYAPFRRPDPPIPANARPTMSMLEDVAAPQRTEPNSKMAKKERNVHCSSIELVSIPQ
jgi:hypothetical protein